MGTQRYDAGYLGKVTKTSQGFARVKAYHGRTGVLKYRNADGTERREYVPPEVLFAQDSLDTLRSAPVTEGHVAMVNPGNVRQLQRGVVENPRADGTRTRLEGEILIQDAETMARVDSGELAELSLGYEVETDDTPGVTPEGEPYDVRQIKRTYNHDALLARGGGRAGRDIALRFDGADGARASEDACYTPINRMATRFDGKDFDSAELALGAAATLLDQARADAKSARTKAETEAARADSAEAAALRAADPKRVSELVRARVALDSAAIQVLGATYDPSKKSEREVMVDVIRVDQKDFKDADSEGKPRSADYLLAAYERAVQSGVRADGVPALGAAIVAARKDGKEPVTPDTREDSDVLDAEAAHRDMVEANRTAWQRKPAAAA